MVGTIINKWFAVVWRCRDAPHCVGGSRSIPVTPVNVSVTTQVGAPEAGRPIAKTAATHKMCINPFPLNRVFHFTESWPVECTASSVATATKWSFVTKPPLFSEVSVNKKNPYRTLDWALDNPSSEIRVKT